MPARLKTRFWVDAYLTRLRLVDIAAFITAHGDDDAGAVLVKSNSLDGKARLFAKSFDPTSGAPVWAELASGPESEIDDTITRQRGYDPDLWVIEVEDMQGRHLLNEEGLA